MSLSTLVAQEKQRQIHDSDSDGDGWCALHPEIKHRSKKKDTDKDGVTEYKEMLLMRNASIADEPSRKLTTEEIKTQQESKKITQIKRVQ